MKLRALAVFLLLGLAACSGQVAVPNIQVETPAGITPTSGKYAAVVQSGGWQLKTDPSGWTCGAWHFNVDVNGPYEQAMRDVLTRSLEKVDFTGETYSPARLKELGYDAQIILYQGNANSSFGVNPGFFTGSANSEIALTVTLAVLDDGGLSAQHTITGKGTGKQDVMVCNTIGDAVAKAAQDAIQDIVKNSLLYVRDSLRERQLKKMASQGKPTS
jgi:hypothetical protein